MLKKIQIKNFYSIYDEETIDFTKDNYKFKDNMIYHELVNPVGIYGLNGSGKTTLLKAIYNVSRLMYQSVSNADFAFFPNMLDNNIKSENQFNILSQITFQLLINQTNYEYSIAAQPNNGIRFEKLVNLDENKTLFIRENERLFDGRESMIEGVFYPALRFIGKEETSKEISKVFEFFKEIVYIDLQGSVHGDLLEKTKDIDLIYQYSSQIKDIIQEYGDFPIYDIFQEENKEDFSKIYYVKMAGSDFKIPYYLMSEGIQTHNRLLATLLSMPKNSLILVDEIEHNLHSFIAQKLVKKMNSFDIQMIFTSHNTSLFQQLRPDQIVFARWENNESKYKKLSKIYPNIREVNNIEKMYFGGLFDEEK